MKIIGQISINCINLKSILSPPSLNVSNTCHLMSHKYTLIPKSPCCQLPKWRWQLTLYIELTLAINAIVFTWINLSSDSCYLWLQWRINWTGYEQILIYLSARLVLVRTFVGMQFRSLWIEILKEYQYIESILIF